MMKFWTFDIARSQNVQSNITLLRFKSIHLSYNIHTCFPMIASTVVLLG